MTDSLILSFFNFLEPVALVEDKMALSMDNYPCMVIS
jgi:hypothetical protein